MISTIDDFWWIIELSRVGSDRTDVGQAQRLYEELVSTSASKIAFFSSVWSSLSECIGSNHLEAGYTLIAGGFSNDSYDYFRNWIIAMGRVFYERIRQEPDSLAELGVLSVEDISFERVKYAQAKAFERLVGPGTFLSMVNYCDLAAIRREVRSSLPALRTELSDDWESITDAARFCPRLANLYGR